MSEHTKGPWEFRTHHTCHTVKTLGEFGAAIGDSARQVCNIPKPRNPESVANARLIAAAPELLEALKTLRSFMWSEGYADQTVAMAQADAAIDKAEGRSCRPLAKL